ncbi:MAG TPA: hypothetical protein VE987_06190, partial [Polyangiaceae bacterium]|nr:hypothetical protein [Polyangiaceae bacterium]
MRLAWWSALRPAGALLACAAALVAWIQGGGADPRLVPPRPEAAPARDGGEAPAGGEAYVVKTRLVEALGDATLDVPSLAASQPYFQSYWRKLRGPWVRPGGTAGQLVTTIALHTNSEAETQWAIATQTGIAWAPNVRVWNMNEGTFDQREAIYAPTPASMRFRIGLPAGARLRFSAAVATPLPQTTVFDVSLVDAAGTEHPVTQRRLAPGDVGRWVDVEADLAPWAQQRVELALRTWTERPAAGEKRWVWPSAVEG